MEYIEAVNEVPLESFRRSLFLAGGITDCPDWQEAMVCQLFTTDLVILNPRRKNFPIEDPNAAKEQIFWEYYCLKNSFAVSFWFCKETLCPIVLYELGKCCMMDKPILVGVHPEYKRRQDVEIQTNLIRPEIQIVYSIRALCQQVKELFSK